MTEELAKQKVRETHPAAFRSARGTVWSEHGMTKIRLGKNWQNAAESLPAAPEQETDEKDDAWKSMVESILPEPVAPVEAKEKEYRYQLYLIHSGEVVGTYCRLESAEDARHNAQMEPKYYAIRDVAEPKPTPSAPTDYARCENCDCAISTGPQGWVHEDSDQRNCEAANPKTRDALEEMCQELHQEWEAGTTGFTNDELEMAEIGFRGGFKAALKLKSQPDSSSIPDIELELRRMMWLGHGHTGMYGDDGEMQCGECRPFGVVDYKREPLDKVRETFRAVQMERMMKPRDSSSISTEQTFDDWWDKSVQPDYFRDMRTIAKQAWNAAKGQR